MDEYLKEEKEEEERKKPTQNPNSSKMRGLMKYLFFLALNRAYIPLMKM